MTKQKALQVYYDLNQLASDVESDSPVTAGALREQAGRWADRHEIRESEMLSGVADEPARFKDLQ